MGRRRFVKKAIGVDVSVASLQYGTKEGLAEAADDSEVPYVKFLHGNPNSKEGREPIYGSIDRNEHIRRRTAIDLRNRTTSRLRRAYSDELLQHAEFVPMSHSHTGFGVRIPYQEHHDRNGDVTTPEPSFEEVQEEFERSGRGEVGEGEEATGESRENIPIRVKRVVSEDTCVDNEQDEINRVAIENVRAGVDMTFQSDAGPKGSLCAAFNSKEYGEEWISSGHLTQPGDDAYQGPLDSLQKVGITRQADVFGEIDWAYIENTEGSVEPTAKLADPEGIESNDAPIGGIVADRTLENKAGTEETYYTQAQRTSRLSGSLTKIDGVGSSYVRATHDVTFGDSGGLFFGFGPNDFYAYVGGVIFDQVGDDSDGDACGDDVRCTTAETVENKAGGHFIA